MSFEVSQKIPEPQTYEDLSAVIHDNAIGLRAKLGRIAGATLIAASSILGFSSIDEIAAPLVAHADSIDDALGTYPDKGDACRPVDVISPPQKPTDASPYVSCRYYDWGVSTPSGGFAFNSDRGYGYRNCTDWAAFRVSQASSGNASVPHGLGNAKDWYSKSPASEQSSTPKAGEVAVSTSGDYGHVAFVEAVTTDGKNMTISEYNYDMDGHGDQRTISTSNSEFTEYIDYGIKISGNSGPAPAPNPNTALQMLLTPGQAVYGKVVNGKDSWNRESFDGTVTKIAAGGYVQMALANNGEVWARNTDTAGTNWTKESDAGTGADIAVSSTGVQMVRATDNEVWAKNSIGYKGWTGEAGAGTAAAIAVGGDTQMLITGDGTVYAKNGIGVDGWHKETDAHVGAKIAASSTGVQMVGVTNGEVWAKQNDVNYGGWTPEASAGTAASIAAGGDNQMLITGDGTVYAKNTIGVNGWNRETDAGVGTAASVSTAGLQMLETTDGQVWSMTSISYNNWTGEADPGTAVAVATGG